MSPLPLLLPSLLVFLLGASVGSFLNVVIYRLPAGLSLLRPPSRCPQCHTRLKPYDNLPVVGWLWLRGRCRYCRAAIPIRYPLVEALVGGLFLGTFWQFGLAWTTVAYWGLLSWLVALTFIDLDTLTLPNSLTQSGLVVGLMVQAGDGWLTGGLSASIQGFMAGVVGALAGLWLFDLMGLGASVALGQTALGGGDSKLAALLGAWLGWSGMLLSGFLACGLGAFIGGGAIALRVLHRRQPMPFGPFLALGAIVTLFWGDALIGAYVHLFFPTL
ncbi:Type 4 prepilin-like protein leader peptide-processing enzyme [Halomicronema hongdechloris C2206]|uniref:Prepilin leader peptidase/N-methyltransferase n=1 Tax=Halomicronema hongdechloris C2206 TaxID=1641165 RepID=A0A1Z3HFT6_9CYAN|nr:A24 family peptidase [Halomicronema hongdechloris]ASC69140.1 Type 4 prepilin-like protein leader peptide-processing enzyme [Halomicronema hongdechloris C2206]